MKYALIAALTASVGLTTAALAQTTPTAEGSAQTAVSGLPADWQGEIAAAFFADPETGTLRSEEEVRSNWANLSAEQKASVTGYCETVVAGTDTDTTASVTTDSETTGDAAAGATTGADATVTASLEQLCGWIENME
jgi:predicted Fe-S protein YdhL (DUF1289 family)